MNFLFDLLQELIYYKDSEKLMLRIHQIQIKKEDGQHMLKATALGEKLDPNRHHTRVDVKAVTLHRFQLEKAGQDWRTLVILDIGSIKEKLCHSWHLPPSFFYEPNMTYFNRTEPERLASVYAARLFLPHFQEENA